MQSFADLLTMCALDVQASTKSHFCTSLLIQPPAGAWDVQLAAPRVCWAVPSGPEPATRPELRAAKVLWIVGIGPSPATQGELPFPELSSFTMLEALHPGIQAHILEIVSVQSQQVSSLCAGELHVYHHQLLRTGSGIKGACSPRACEIVSCADSASPACIDSRSDMQRIGCCYGLWPVSGALPLAAALAAAALPSHVLCSGDSTAAA